MREDVHKTPGLQPPPRPEARDVGAAVSESRSWAGAGCSVDSWRLVAERGVSTAVGSQPRKEERRREARQEFHEPWRQNPRRVPYGPRQPSPPVEKSIDT